jgi:hypothetical protein
MRPGCYCYGVERCALLAGVRMYAFNYRKREKGSKIYIDLNQSFKHSYSVTGSVSVIYYLLVIINRKGSPLFRRTLFSETGLDL